ncbi:MAG TPA: aquaporin [Opitutaceae bacterium]|nr:aquaporin [Opitutaceae bacterium]
MNAADESLPEDLPGVIPAARRLFAECVGTFALTLFDCGAKMVGALSGEVSHLAQALAPGLVVAAMIYAIGRCSGAHINPAVTLAFATRGVFPWRRVPGYWLAQIAGAIAAAALLHALFGDVAHLGATRPRGPWPVSFVLESVLGFMLVMVVLGTATQHRIVGPNAALAVGAIIIACGVFGKAISGASMNPARSLGPALVGGELGSVWIYLAGPALGALLAVGATAVIHGPRRQAEIQAASGRGARRRR